MRGRGGGEDVREKGGSEGGGEEGMQTRYI